MKAVDLLLEAGAFLATDLVFVIFLLPETEEAVELVLAGEVFVIEG